MHNTTKIYLAYGSNLNLEQMKFRCPYARPLGVTEIENYQLLFRGFDENAVATIEPKTGSRVPVLIWEITPVDEKSLDRYEGFPRLYRKEEIDFTVVERLKKGKERKRRMSAMVYIMNAENRPLGKPSEHYYNVIKAGYNELEFDTAILDKAVTDSLRSAD